MGKRKKSSRKPGGTKKKEPLPTTFQCLFCNHEKSVTARVDKKIGIGMLSCKVCGQTHQCEINYLSAPVDVYYDWIDAAEAVNKPTAAEDLPDPVESVRRGIDDPAARTGRLTSGGGEKDEGNLEGFVEDDDGDMEGEYADEGDIELDE